MALGELHSIYNGHQSALLCENISILSEYEGDNEDSKDSYSSSQQKLQVNDIISHCLNKINEVEQVLFQLSYSKTWVWMSTKMCSSGELQALHTAISHNTKTSKYHFFIN